MVKILLHEIPALSGDYWKEMPLAEISATQISKKVNKCNNHKKPPQPKA